MTLPHPSRQQVTHAVGQPIEDMNMLSRIYESSRTSINNLPEELLEYLPTSKYDLDCIQRLSQLEPSQRNILLPQLLTWIQDINWPNAGEITPFLIAGGQEIIPEIAWVLNGQDDIWKGNCIRRILPYLSSKLVLPLLPILKRIAENPTENEKAEETDLDAAACIAHHHLAW